MTSTTEEAAPAETQAPPSLTDVITWRMDREAVLFAPGSCVAVEALRSVAGAQFDRLDEAISAQFDRARHEAEAALAAARLAAWEREAFTPSPLQQDAPVAEDVPPLPKRVPMPYSVNPWSPEPAVERESYSLFAASLAAALPGPLPAAETEAEFVPELPPAQEAALEAFNAAHDAEDAEARPDDDPDPDPDDDDLPPAASTTETAGDEQQNSDEGEV